MAILPQPLQSQLDALAAGFFDAPGMKRVDFATPAGAAALVAPDSVSWRIMKNPVALVVGGIAAVILELAEPRVRSGVWDHTSFRTDPVRRMKRTGYAAMVTVYGPADAARAMIAGVARAHQRVEGRTPAGVAYRANDVELLNWVQATAMYGFIEAYHRFVRPLSAAEIDQTYAEGAPAAALYSATSAPTSRAELDALMETMRPKLERSPIVFEFLDIVRNAPLLPSRTLQHMMIRAAVEITPNWARDTLGLSGAYGLRPGEEGALKLLGATSDRLCLQTAPPAQACTRLGLKADYLYR